MLRNNIKMVIIIYIVLLNMTRKYIGKKTSGISETIMGIIKLPNVGKQLKNTVRKVVIILPTLILIMQDKSKTKYF